MVAWPASLPAPALNTLSESPPDNVIRSNMDKGPAIVRRRTTANIRPISFGLILTAAETQILDEFYTDDTFSGSESFDFTHPRTGAAVTARFVEPPEYQEREGAAWAASVSLEILP